MDLSDANSIVDARHKPHPHGDAEKDVDSGKESDSQSGHASIRAGHTRGLTVAEPREEVGLDVDADESQSIYDSKSRESAL